MTKPTKWKRTGDCRIVPWYFGLMRAEFEERRHFPSPYGGDDAGNGTFQIRWVSAGKFPWKYDNPYSPFGFWSTMSTPLGATKIYGDRALWKGFITYFKAKKDQSD